MWQAVDPSEVNSPLTTLSAWRHPSGTVVGVMRPFMLSPPVLWVELRMGALPQLRQARTALTLLQKQLNTPTIWAMADPDICGSARFLRFLGFDEKQTLAGETYYERSL